MKKAVWLGVCGLFFLGILLAAADSADARNQYKKAWDDRYMQPDSEMAKALGGKSNCNVCHAGMKRKNRNAYGMALSKLVGKNDMDKDKVAKALETIEAEKSNPSDESSPTWSDLIKSGKLPVTKEEPAAGQ